MRKARFTEHQIIAVIKSVEAGRTVKDVCREAGISEATYYLEVVNKNWPPSQSFSSINFPIRLGVTHRYIRAVLVRCNIQRYNPLWRELPR